MSKSVARALSLLVLLFGMMALMPGLASATNWSDGVIMQSGNMLIDPDKRELGGCYFYDASLTQVTAVKANTNSPLTTYTPLPEAEYTTSSPQSKCMVRNNNGYFWANWWAPVSPSSTMELTDVGGSIWAAPNSEYFLHMGTIPRQSTRKVSINKNFSPGVHGKMSTRAISRSNQLTFAFYQTSVEPALTYSNGELVQASQYGVWFSSNGLFAVLHLPYRGFVLLDFEAETLTPFFPLSASRVNARVSVSNDGQTIAVDTSIPAVYSASGCTAYSYDEIPVSMFSDMPADCGDKLFDATGLIASDLNIYTRSLGVSLNQTGNKLIHDRADSNDNYVRYEFYPSSAADENGEFAGVQGYLALGDSFVSGEGDRDGNNWYEPGTNVHGEVSVQNLCHVSRRSYSYLIARDLGYNQDLNTPALDGLFHSVACSGTKIHNVIGGEYGDNQTPESEKDLVDTDNQFPYNRDSVLGSWHNGATKQHNYLLGGGSFDFSTGIGYMTPAVLTIGIGGNDAGFSDILKNCLVYECEYAQQGSLKMSNLVISIAGLKDELANTYRQVKQAAPDTRIYAIGYPIFATAEDDQCGTLGALLSRQERELIDQSIRYLNKVIKAAADEAGVVYVEIGDSLGNAKLCGTESDIAFNGLSKGDDNDLEGICFITECVGNESFHPNELGHSLIQSTIMTRTNNLTIPMPAPTPTQIPLPDLAYFGDAVAEQVQNINMGNSFRLRKPKAISTLVAVSSEDNVELNIAVDGLAPGSIAQLYVASTPQLLGAYEVDQDGAISTEVMLPVGLEPGYHELYAVANTLDGREVEYYQSFVKSYSADDFDGDGILNSDDSCGVVPNSNIDADRDGLDDACDITIVATIDEKEINNESDEQAKINIFNPYSNPPAILLATDQESASEQAITSGLDTVAEAAEQDKSLKEVQGVAVASAGEPVVAVAANEGSRARYWLVGLLVAGTTTTITIVLTKRN